MSLLDEIKRDREAGTPGRFAVKKRGHARVEAVGGMSVADCGGHRDNTRDLHDEQIANANRCARVPDMEKALLAAERLAHTSDNLRIAIGMGWDLEGVLHEYDTALAAFRAATE
jgi:hypothetical protein